MSKHSKDKDSDNGSAAKDGASVGGHAHPRRFSSLPGGGAHSAHSSSSASASSGSGSAGAGLGGAEVMQDGLSETSANARGMSAEERANRRKSVASSLGSDVFAVPFDAETVASAEESQKLLERRINSGHFIRKFKLPPDTTLLYDSVCVLYKSSLPLQGRLYLSQNHVCFFSKVFGMETKEVIRLAEVTSISKRGLNHIEVVTQSEKFTFAGFLSRDKTYLALQSSWERAVGSAPPPAHVSAGQSTGSFVVTPAGPPPTAPATPGVTDSSQPPSPDPAASVDAVGEDLMLSEEFDDGKSGFLELNTMKEVVKGELPLPATKVFKMFFADNSSGWNTYHTQREDKNVFVGNWATHEKFGNIREKRSVVLTHAPIGPASSRYEETHRYSLTKNRLVVEMVGTTLDVPYGDCFRVEAKWIINQNSPNSCELSISCGCRWIKRALLKGTVEAMTMKGTTENYKLWLELARKQIAALPQDNSPSPANSAPPSPSKPHVVPPATTVPVKLLDSSAAAIPGTKTAEKTPLPMEQEVAQNGSALEAVLSVAKMLASPLGSVSTGEWIQIIMMFVFFTALYKKVSSIESMLHKP